MNTRSYPASVPRLVPGSRWRRRGADSRSSSGGYRGGSRGSRAASLPPAKASSCPPNSDPCRLGATAMLSRSRYSGLGSRTMRPTMAEPTSIIQTTPSDTCAPWSTSAPGRGGRPARSGFRTYYAAPPRGADRAISPAIWRGCRRANPFLWTGNSDPKIEAFCGFPRGSRSSRSAKVGAFPFAVVGAEGDDGAGRGSTRRRRASCRILSISILVAEEAPDVFELFRKRFSS